MLSVIYSIEKVQVYRPGPDSVLWALLNKHIIIGSQRVKHRDLISQAATSTFVLISVQSLSVTWVKFHRAEHIRLSEQS